MKISIVTPSYNQGEYIEDAIKSVLSQGYDNFEHIIVDGLSDDNTINILKKYDHLIWKSEEDINQSDALNKGFKKATGDIIGWLNADDVYLPDTFNHVVNEFKHTNVDAVYSNFYHVDKYLNVIKKGISRKPSFRLSLFSCFIASTTFFFKKEIITENILIDIDFHICMDKEFFAHIFKLDYKMSYSREFFAKFRWHETNKSIDDKKTRRIRLKEGIVIFNRYSKFFKFPNNILGIKMYEYISFVVIKTYNLNKLFRNR